MIDCLSIFEIGSTSAAPVKQHSPVAITLTSKGSASLAHQQYDPKTITDKNNGSSSKNLYLSCLLRCSTSLALLLAYTPLPCD
uniref:Uncharacterized protein n=1 Tax=Solanum tuberosum TaxID=4113 RepID=M1BVE2_SOLTU